MREILAELTVWLSAFVIVLGRLAIKPRLDIPTVEGSFEAFAHLFVGGLFGFWLARRGTPDEAIEPYGLRMMFLAFVLSAFELFLFLIQKFGG